MEQKQKFSIQRSTEGTIFEIATIILTIIVWVVIVLALRHAPDRIITHFDAMGRPDDYGSKWNVVFHGILLTIAGLGCLAGAYFPHSVNLPVSINNLRQALLVSRMMRILAIIFILMTMTVTLGSLHQPAMAAPVLVPVGLLVGIIIFFSVMVYKAR